MFGSNAEANLQVTVTREDFEKGSFPNVCPQTGLLAIKRYPVFARGAGGTKATGEMFFHSSVQRLRVVFLSVLLVCLAIFGLLLGFVLITHSLRAIFVLCALLVCAALGQLFLRKLSKRWTHANLVDSDHVVIGPVARDFYDAMQLRPMKCSGCEEGSCCSSQSNNEG